MLSRNPKLKPAEPLVRGFLAEIRSIKRPGIARFGSDFETLLRREQKPGCFNQRLCIDKIVPPFVHSEPVAVTDLFRFVFDSSCFGFLPDRENQLAAVEALDRAAARVNIYNVVDAFSLADRIYLFGRFADLLATVRARWGESVAPNIGRLMKAVHAEGRPSNGTAYPVDARTVQLARKACVGVYSEP